MSRDTGQAPDRSRERPEYRLRRLPDRKHFFWYRKFWEVALFPPGSDLPCWTCETPNLGRVLGLHPTDEWDYKVAADVARDDGFAGWVSPWASRKPLP